MSAQIIDGKAVAQRVRARVAEEVAALGRRPGLATILVGDDPASAVYVRMKREDSAEVGIESFHHEPGGDVAPDELAALIRALNDGVERGSPNARPARGTRAMHARGGDGAARRG
jgi:methylenetetrahydrofolate dehydrogenase (NADP+) / methenyltetrahydrofolate cyclohydrolase